MAKDSLIGAYGSDGSLAKRIRFEIQNPCLSLSVLPLLKTLLHLFFMERDLQSKT